MKIKAADYLAALYGRWKGKQEKSRPFAIAAIVLTALAGLSVLVDIAFMMYYGNKFGMDISGSAVTWLTELAVIALLGVSVFLYVRGINPEAEGSTPEYKQVITALRKRTTYGLVFALTIPVAMNRMNLYVMDVFKYADNGPGETGLSVVALLGTVLGYAYAACLLWQGITELRAFGGKGDISFGSVRNKIWHILAYVLATPMIYNIVQYISRLTEMYEGASGKGGVVNPSPMVSLLYLAAIFGLHVIFMLVRKDTQTESIWAVLDVLGFDADSLDANADSNEDDSDYSEDVVSEDEGDSRIDSDSTLDEDSEE